LPELPEVETVVGDLRPSLVGARIVACRLPFPSIVRHPEARLFIAGVSGRRVQALNRRGKYILAGLDSGDLLVVHLGMSGQLRLHRPDEEVALHTHAFFSLDSGIELRYRDPRRFGRLLLGTESALVAAGKLPKLGPEPLDPAFGADQLYLRLHRRTAAVKSVLLDQGALAGVGNIYADESCFRARVRPDRPAGALSRRAVRRLHEALRVSLEQGIANRGSSVISYVDGQGQRGSQQEQLLVYGRAGLPCLNCGRPLASVRISGRTTVFCRRCQH
jgi:formamidopyrimidine-DNA glycosylase